MRVLALDYGKKRIGVAISDPSGVIAQPLETIEHDSKHGHWRRLLDLIDEYDIKRLVIGLPLHMSGQEGPEAEAVRRFGAEIEKRADVRIDFMDERWTTKEADAALQNAGTRRSKKRGLKDSIAAAIILRTWMERNPH